MPIDKKYVEAAYHFLLRRPPENERVVEEHARAVSSIEELFAAISSSPEYLMKLNEDSIVRYLYKDKVDIEVKTTRDKTEKMLKKIEKEWEDMSKSEPYWAVLTNDIYKMSNISEERMKEFYDSGLSIINMLEAFLKRNNIDMDLSEKTCFELGCGVGRITIHLAEKFNKVFAMDISNNMVRLAKKNLELFGRDNVDVAHLKKIDEILDIPEYDVFLSIITLQHNPPPVQYYILDRILSKMKDGGIALFQTSFYIHGYSFLIDEYLQNEEYSMEMHALPQRCVYELFAKYNITPVEILYDSSTTWFGSIVYMAQRNATHLC